jgi:hypothetical protein
VFLSVPQRGTNIADFARRYRGVIRAVLSDVEAFLKASQLSSIEKVESKVLSDPRLREWLDTRPNLLSALIDTLRETLPPDDTSTALGRYRAALSRAAFGELTGWIENAKMDFFAIDDLAFRYDGLPTPAHYTDEFRQRETEAWSARGIRTRSFATVGRRPFDEPPRTREYSSLELSALLWNVRPDPVAGTDVLYRLVYALTAAGPFVVTPGNDVVRENGSLRVLQAWENDGIANTASMLWPDGEATELVQGDHGDIIGHYRGSDPIKTVEAVLGRRNHSYDILRSGSGFDQGRFDHVWHGIFDFCASE